MPKPPVFCAPEPPGFSIDTAYYLAVASKAAYDVDPRGRLSGAAFPWPKLVGEVRTFSNGTADEATAVRGAVLATADAVVLAFRGTANLPGWLTDANAVQVPDPDTPRSDVVTRPMVHRGFKLGLDQVWGQVTDALLGKDGLLADGRPLWITGHSLGGALATLAANRLAAKGVTAAGTYTFGSPRVGNDDFFRGYRPVNFRLVNNDDVVPHVPLEDVLVPVQDPNLFKELRNPRSVGDVLAGLRDAAHALHQVAHFTYVHVGSLKYFDRNGHLGEGTSDPGLKDLQVLASLARLGQPSRSGVTDHFMDNYLDAVTHNL